VSPSALLNERTPVRNFRWSSELSDILGFQTYCSKEKHNLYICIITFLWLLYTIEQMSVELPARDIRIIHFDILIYLAIFIKQSNSCTIHTLKHNHFSI
jgi:hypothetical protein